VLAAGDVPQLLPEIQVEGYYCAGGLGRLHAFDDQLRGCFRERGENSAAVEPAHAAGEDSLPVEVTRFEPRRRFVTAIVEDDRRAHTVAAVAIHGGHVRTGDSVVLEALVEGFDAHRFDALGNQFTDWIIDHRAGDAG